MRCVIAIMIGLWGSATATAATIQQVHKSKTRVIVTLDGDADPQLEAGQLVTMTLADSGAEQHGFVEKAMSGKRAMLKFEDEIEGAKKGADVSITPQDEGDASAGASVVVGQVYRVHPKKPKVIVDLAGGSDHQWALGDVVHVQIGKATTNLAAKVTKIDPDRVVFTFAKLSTRPHKGDSIALVQQLEASSTRSGGKHASGPAAGGTKSWSYPGAVQGLVAAPGSRVEAGVVMNSSSSSSGDAKTKRSMTEFVVKPQIALGRRGGASLALIGANGKETDDPGDGGDSVGVSAAQQAIRLHVLPVVADVFAFGFSYDYVTLKYAADGATQTAKAGRSTVRFGYASATAHALLGYAPKTKAKITYKDDTLDESTTAEVSSGLELTAGVGVSPALSLFGDLGYDFDDAEHEDRDALGLNERVSFAAGAGFLVADGLAMTAGLERNRSAFVDALDYDSSIPLFGLFLSLDKSFSSVTVGLGLEHASGGIRRELKTDADTGAALQDDAGGDAPDAVIEKQAVTNILLRFGLDF